MYYFLNCKTYIAQSQFDNKDLNFPPKFAIII